jgi:DNA-binding response OmpR family regulator
MALAADVPLRVVLVEDDAELRDSPLASDLAACGFLVTGVASVTTLYDRLRSDTPDIVILDVRMSDTDGFSVAQAIRTLLPQVGIVLLTGHGDLQDQLRGLSQGADACLVRPVRVELLAATIRSVARRLRGPGASPPPRWRFALHDWCILSPAGRSVPLSRTEQRLVGRLVATLGQLVTREQLIAAVTDDVHDYDPHRIESLIHRLRRKVSSLCGAPLPLASVHGKGYVLHDRLQEALG